MIDPDWNDCTGGGPQGELRPAADPDDIPTVWPWAEQFMRDTQESLNAARELNACVDIALAMPEEPYMSQKSVFDALLKAYRAGRASR